MLDTRCLNRRNQTLLPSHSHKNAVRITHGYMLFLEPVNRFDEEVGFPCQSVDDRSIFFKV